MAAPGPGAGGLASLAPVITTFDRSRAARRRCHALIPGGCHTYAKGEDQYPELAPAYVVRGRGCHVWDVDGNEFIEYGMGLRAVTLGHAYPSVVDAASRQMRLGSNFSLPASLEMEAAERLLSVIKTAEMVKFAKNGSDVTSAAIRLARAYTGRPLIAVCAEHPFFSSDDWFIGTTPMASGIPEGASALTLKFHYNDLDSLRRLFAANPRQVAAVMLEPATTVEPAGSFLRDVRRTCHDNGALLILDEMITGFRWHLGGGQAVYDVEPDLSTFGKALGNGFAVSALAGKRAIMSRGGLHHDRERVFLLSTTHGGESHALAAAIETINVYEREHVVEHLYRQGEALANGIRKAIAEYRLEGHFALLGRPCNLVYATRDERKQPSQAFRALFLQETIKRGLLMPSLVVSFSHTDADIRRTTEGVAEALAVYRRALEDGIEKYLVGRPVKPVFRKLN
jgi:glutamate-1-semialdehyde 2,1-aminomutase